MGKAGILHDGGDVGKVQIDKAGVPDQVGDALHRLAQHVVGNFKGVAEGDLLIGGVLQPLVGDDDQRVHLATKLLNAGLRRTHPLLALEAEGLGDHAHRQDALLPCDLRHHGGCAGAGAAAHTGGDEHHVGILQRLGQLGAALLGGLLAHLRIGACALSVGELLTDLELISGAGGIQRLLIRIDGDEIHALYAGAHHAVDHIIAAAADAHHLDTYHVLRSCFKPKSHDASSCRNLYVKDTFSVRIPKIQYFIYCITVYLSRQVFRRDFPKKSLIRE